MLSLIILFSACAKAPPPPAPSPSTPTPVTSTPPPATQSEGENLYAQKCAVCHGPNAEGTAVGPMITGHSMSAVKMQVRNPMGTMPAFPASQLSDQELEEIAEFIASLGEAKAPLQE